MINSRKIEDLIVPAQSRFKAFLESCAVDPWLIGNGITVILICTLRDREAQAALFAQGRTTKGKIVTNAKPGESWHEYGCAGDVLPLRHGKPIWGTSGNGIDEDPSDDDKDDLEAWQTVGKLGKRAGLEWAGDWKTFRELAHFQYTNGLTLAELQSGRVIA
jgi:peptidoglycan L-alanyl-D-glutamate endopeptidase CwlK